MAAILASRRAPAFCIALRNGMMRQSAPPKPPLPYDAEVEWILSDGSSYIQLPDTTSLVGTTFGDFRGRLDARFLVQKSGTTALQTILAVSGGRTFRVFGTGTAMFNIQIMFPTAGNYGESVAPLGSDVEVSVVVDADGGFYYVNGTLTDSKPRSEWTSAVDGMYMCPLRLLADGTQLVDGWKANTVTRNCTHAKLYWVKYYDGNNNLVFDLQPVRVGQTGYMYDKVGGGLYGNAGSGNLVIGPDKEVQ